MSLAAMPPRIAIRTAQPKCRDCPCPGQNPVVLTYLRPSTGSRSSFHFAGLRWHGFGRVQSRPDYMLFREGRDPERTPIWSPSHPSTSHKWHGPGTDRLS